MWYNKLMTPAEIAQTYREVLTTPKARQVVTQALAAAVRAFQSAGFERKKGRIEMERERVLQGHVLARYVFLVDPIGGLELQLHVILALQSGGDSGGKCELWLRVKAPGPGELVCGKYSHVIVSVLADSTDMRQNGTKESLFEALSTWFVALIASPASPSSGGLAQSGTELLKQYSETVSP